MTGPRTTKKPRGFRRLERWFIGVIMAVIAFFLERVVMRAVKKRSPKEAPKPQPTTLTSKGGEIDLPPL